VNQSAWRREHPVLSWLARVLCAIVLVACAARSSQVNVVRSAGLAETTSLEIAELVTEPNTDYVDRLTVTDADTLLELVGTLDKDLPLGPRARCLGQYRLRFHLQSGQVEEFEYFCQEAPFLRGSQAFWAEKQVEPPAEFVTALRDLLAAVTGKN
jgi:hypothetical protein